MSKHVVITGANRGIGLELARQWHERGERVTALCRRASEALLALNIRVIEDVDVTDEAVINRLPDDLNNETVDILFNNAGLLTDEGLHTLNMDRIRHQFEINALGPLNITAALLPLLKKGSKVALMSSRMGSISDNGSGGRYGYRMTKAALNAAGKSLAIDLAPSEVSVAVLHPGYVKTAMTGHTGHLEPAEAARRLIQRVDELTLENSGRFWHSDGSELPW